MEIFRDAAANPAPDAKSDLEIVRNLLKNGANINGETPLSLAAKNVKDDRNIVLNALKKQKVFGESSENNVNADPPVVQEKEVPASAPPEPVALEMSHELSEAIRILGTPQPASKRATL